VNAKLIGLLCASLLAQGAVAANTKDRVQAFSKLPDWSGMWENALPMKDVKFEPTPFNAEWQAKADAARAKQSIRYYCAEGMPLMMEVPAQINMFEAFVDPDSVFFNFSTHEVRHIYTDGRKHPAPRDLLPSPVGDSIGHWEGETLVIDTSGTRQEMQSVELVEFHKDHPEPAAIKSVPMSDKLHFVERIRLIDHDHLEDKLTISDPVALTHPVEEIIRYQRVKDLDRMIYDDCVENERNPIVGGKVITVDHPLPPQK
jgi:hypothetical protein